MPKVIFTETRLVQDQHVGTPQETRFKKGEVYDLPVGSCERWIRRGAAQYHVEAEKPVDAGVVFGRRATVIIRDEDFTLARIEPAADAPATDPAPDTVEIPADWQDLAWPALRSLAAKLTADPVGNKAAAVAAVEAELARRAAA